MYFQRSDHADVINADVVNAGQDDGMDALDGSPGGPDDTIDGDDLTPAQEFKVGVAQRGRYCIVDEGIYYCLILGSK